MRSSMGPLTLDRYRATSPLRHVHGRVGCCVNGGGQPHQPAVVRETIDLRAVRAAVLYNDDAKADLRKSHENSAVKKLYDEYFGEPNSHKAHEILHTHYVKRGL